ncbi:MAG: hypothetical protein F6J90_38290 [Moorea sp. SIOASIH]|uniref:hypothetical protein n=1 Tax=Moorena sp. SIOASIH TaxID=2607817 RepID=UPI0013BC7842|nr:hypothetical protein [Moorena sp. SIOASIH]NEO41862.1 hypothetical protein [Moorena sp. SIOASIH]
MKSTTIYTKLSGIITPLPVIYCGEFPQFKLATELSQFSDSFSLLPTPYSLLPVPCSLFPVPYFFPTPYSLFPTPFTICH